MVLKNKKRKDGHIQGYHFGATPNYAYATGIINNLREEKHKIENTNRDYQSMGYLSATQQAKMIQNNRRIGEIDNRINFLNNSYFRDNPR